MPNDILKNFFGIRIQVKTHEKIILGIIPIFLILLLWIFVTSGSSTTLVLPEGIFEGFENSAPKVGHFFSDRIRYSIEGASLDYNEEEDSTSLVKDELHVKLGQIPASPFGKQIRLTLPPGRIIERTLPEAKAPPIELPAPQTSSPETGTMDGGNPTYDAAAASPALDLSAKPDQQPVKTKNFNGTITYRFESVETRIISQVILPSPLEVLRSLPALWVERSLLTNILFSFLRVGTGFLVAFLIVFPTSLLMGTFSKFHALFSPLMMFGGYLPIPALVPLTMVLFGTTEQQKVMFLALGFSIYLMPLFVKALEEVDNVYLQTGLTLGARKFQILNKILLPIAMPKIYDAMRLGFGIGWGYIILAEMVDMGSKGVGTLILTSQRRGPREDIYLVLIAIVVMAFITDKIWEKVGDRLFPYRSQKR